jgi:hypothetical protein
MGTGKCHFRFVVKQDIISGLTFARGSNQPFLSNAIVFLSSSRANIFRLFNFENTVEGIPLLILIYHKSHNSCLGHLAYLLLKDF